MRLLPSRFSSKRAHPLVLCAVWASAAALTACATTYPNGKPPTFGDVQVGMVDIAEPRSTGGYEHIGSIQGQPIADKPHFVMVVIPTPVATAELELRDDAGRLLKSLPLAVQFPGQSGYEALYITKLTPPEKPFQVYVSGKSSDGKPFRQDSKSRFVGQYVHLDSEPTTFACVGGPPYEHQLTLENRGPADRFEILLQDDSGYVVSPLRQEISLAADQSHPLRVRVQLPPSAPMPAPMQLDYHSVRVTVRSLTKPSRETGIRLSATIPGPDEDGTPDDRCEP
jgi:hypothetical protein